MNNTIKSKVTVIAALAISGCATPTYAPLPDLETPPSFKGAAGWIAIPDETKVEMNEAGLKDRFIKQKVKFRRTAVLENDIVQSSWIGDRVVLKKGSKLYASRYRSGYSLRGGGISWCSPGDPDVSEFESLMIGGGTTTCLFWNKKTGKITYGVGRASDSAYYSNAQTVQPGVFVNFPDITETGESLDEDFFFTGAIQKISKDMKTMTFRLRFEDKSGDTTMYQKKLPVDANGVATLNLWGGELALKPSGTDSFSVAEIKPVQSVAADPDSLVEKLIEELQKARDEKDAEQSQTKT